MTTAKRFVIDLGDRSVVIYYNAQNVMMLSIPGTGIEYRVDSLMYSPTTPEDVKIACQKAIKALGTTK